MNKIIIAGGRDFSDYKLLCEKLDILLSNFELNNVEVVCGLAKGADLLGKMWAKENNITISEFPANWDRYGKSAGYIRNNEMAEYATHLVAFWNGKSKGTKHMIDLAKQKGLDIRVINY